MFRYSYFSHKFLLSFIRYLFIGCLVAVVDISMFQLLILIHLHIALAATIAYTLAVTSHFTLNKFFNFKNFERSTTRQLRTYTAVVTFCWLVTLIAIEIGVRVGLSPLQAKLVAVVLNIPTGYLGNYYLTFGSGIRATLRRWRS